MPANNPQVGEIYNMAASSDQWMYVYQVKGPYVYLSGIHSTNGHIKIRKGALRGFVNHHNYGSNGIALESGGILGLGGWDRAEGVLFLIGEDGP
jgi:hypothetical protein